MKVLFISSGNAEGGITSTIKNQGNSLMNNGIAIDYFSIKGHGTSGYIKNIGLLRKQIRERNYDIIHAHYGYSILLAVISCTGLPIIGSFMGDDLLGTDRKDCTYTKIKKCLPYIYKLLSRYYLDYTIVKSKSMGYHLLKKTRYSIIPNGIDFSRFYVIDKNIARDKLQIDKSKKIVLFVSDDDVSRKVKNYSLAREVFDILDIENKLFLTISNVPHSMMNLYYNAADVLLLTSYIEGSPNVIKEALACNLPMVTTDVGDIREITEKIEGCYVCEYDQNEIKKYIEFILSNDTKNDSRNFIKYLEINTIAQNIIDIYKKMS